MKHLIFLVSVLLSLLSTSASAAKWHEVDTPYFTILTDHDPKVAEEISQELLRLRFLVGYLTAINFDALEYAPPKLNIILLERRKYHNRLKGSKHIVASLKGNMEQRTLTAILPSRARSFTRNLFQYKKVKELFIYDTIKNYSNYRIPYWYRMGLVDYYSSINIFYKESEHSDSQYTASISPFISEYSSILDEDEWFSFEKLIKANGRYVDDGRNSIVRQSALSWLFAAYVFEHSSYARTFQHFIERNGSERKVPQELWRNTMGETADQTLSRLRDFKKNQRGMHRELKMTFKQLGYNDPPIVIRVLEPLKKQAVLAHVDFVSSEEPKWRRALCDNYSRKNAVGGGNADLSAFLLRSCDSVSNLKAEAAWLDVIKRVEPDSSLRYAFEAEWLIKKVDYVANEAERRKLLGEARVKATEAVARDPASVRGLHAYTTSLLMEGKMTETGLKAARSAAAILPEHTSIQRNLVKALTLNGNDDEASEYIDSLAYWSPSEHHDRMIEDLRLEVRDMRSRNEPTSAEAGH